MSCGICISSSKDSITTEIPCVEIEHRCEPSPLTVKQRCVPHIVALLTNFGNITFPTRPSAHHQPEHPPTATPSSKDSGMHGLTSSLPLRMAGGTSWSRHSHVCNGGAFITFCSRSHRDRQLLFRCIFNLTINQGVLLTNGRNYRKGHYWYGYACVCVCSPV